MDSETPTAPEIILPLSPTWARIVADALAADERAEDENGVIPAAEIPPFPNP